ncbi:site-specific integrase [Parabacteroides distasonis]|uniref:site-specific integrase n=1 Tax=Parabacteroides distasonis TaxID=823 RepID=UPI0018AB55E0|nr:site-specific integrase [Parabacteroides distasonis]
MARKKNEVKAKEPVKLRFKKLSNANQSIYLDIYYKGKRYYEFLKLYLTPERFPEDRDKNRITLRLANSIKAQRIIDLQNEIYGVRMINGLGKKTLLEFLSELYTDKSAHGDKAYSLRLRSLANHLRDYMPQCLLKDIDTGFVKGFIAHLRKQPYLKSDFTIHGYYRLLNVTLNKAVKKGLILSNPCGSLDTDEKPHKPTSLRTYLTLEELKRLIRTDCACPEVKKAFLFCCFCGLRISDLTALRWEDMQKEGNDKFRLQIIQRKTKEAIYLPLSEEAIKYLPARENDNDRVGLIFHLPSLTIICQVLKGWTLAAGIKNKKVTFHVSRHTFATLSLALGIDLYTVCKLLGHKNIISTQVYAKIIDASKRQAIDRFNGVLDA